MQKNKKIKQYSKVFGLDLESLKKRYYEKYHLKLVNLMILNGIPNYWS